MARTRRHRVLRSKLARRVRIAGARLGLDRHWHLVGIAAIIGLVIGGVATAFIHPLRLEEHWLAGLDRDLLFWIVPLAPMVGGLIAGYVVHIMPYHVKGPGVSIIMYSVSRTKGQVSPRVGVRKWLAATATIGSGGSAGAEGPIVTIGAVIGSNVGRWLRMGPQDTATLLGCGAAAGIASVFSAPIAGIFFVLEILLRDFSLRTFTPIVIASVMAVACTDALLGDHPALFAVADDFFIEKFTIIEIPNYLMLGVICGVVGALFILAMYVVKDFYSRLKIHPVLKPVTGAAILGLMGLAYMLFHKTGSAIPQFYGNGYPVIRELLNRETYMVEGVLKPVGTLLGLLMLLVVLKPIATCLTIGSGGSGGFFAPSLLLGAAIGGAFGTVVEGLGWAPSANPAHYAVVGMAAMVAIVLHAPLTAILIVYEITQSYEIILPLMFTAIIATIMGRLISPESMYTTQLARLGVRIGVMSDLTILRRLSVDDVVLVPPVLVHPGDSAQHLLDLIEERSVTDFVVIDDRGHYVGLVTGADLREILVYREAIPLLQVHELQRSNLPTVSPHDTLDIVLDKFSRHDVHSLAVLDDTGKDDVRGLITRSNLMQRYQHALSRDS